MGSRLSFVETRFACNNVRIADLTNRQKGFSARNVGFGFKVYMTRNFMDLLGIVYFIVIAFLVAELFKVLIYAN